MSTDRKAAAEGKEQQGPGWMRLLEGSAESTETLSVRIRPRRNWRARGSGILGGENREHYGKMI